MIAYTWMRDAEILNRYGFQGKEWESKTQWYDFHARQYDPALGRWFALDPANQFASGYMGMGNNPLIGVDPNGRWFLIDDLIAAGAGFAFGYLAHGITTGDWGWKAVASGGVGALTAWVGLNTFGAGAAGIAASGIQNSTWAYVGNMAIGTVVGQIVPPIQIPIGDNFTIGFSPSFGIGTNGFVAGANFSATYRDKKFVISAGYGISSNSHSWGAGATIDGIGGSYYKTRYGNAIGPDGKPNPQKVGALGFQFNDVSFRLENDFFAGGGGDKWRTNAWELRSGDFVIGGSIRTNNPKNNETWDGKSKIWGSYRKGYSTWEKGKVYSAPVWVGFRKGNNISRIGYSDKNFQDFQQNGAHKYLARQNYYLDYTEFKKGLYSYYGNYNPYSLFD